VSNFVDRLEVELAGIGKSAVPGHTARMADADGRALVLQAHSADLQDCDGAVPLLKASRKASPFVERAFADSGYRAERVS
jgi:hypothetical protein